MCGVKPAKKKERKLVSQIIEAVPGVRRAVHVMTPVLLERIKDKKNNRPAMALRSSLHNYSKVKLYERIEFMGPSSLDPLFDNPLPGTDGRGVAIMFTDFPLRVWYYEDQKPRIIDSTDGRKAEDVLKDIKTKYNTIDF